MKDERVSEESVRGNFPPLVRFTIETMENVWPTVEVLPLLTFLSLDVITAAPQRSLPEQ